MENGECRIVNGEWKIVLILRLGGAKGALTKTGVSAPFANFAPFASCTQ